MCRHGNGGLKEEVWDWVVGWVEWMNGIGCMEVIERKRMGFLEAFLKVFCKEWNGRFVSSSYFFD